MSYPTYGPSSNEGYRLAGQAIGKWFSENVSGTNDLPNITEASFWSPAQYKDKDGKDKDEETFGVSFEVTPWNSESVSKWFKFEAGLGLKHKKLSAEYGASLSIATALSYLIRSFEGKLASATAEINVAALAFKAVAPGVKSVEIGSGSDIEVTATEGAVTSRKFLATLPFVKLNAGLQLEAKDKQLEAALSRAKTSLAEAQSNNFVAAMAQVANI